MTTKSPENISTESLHPNLPEKIKKSVLDTANTLLFKGLTEDEAKNVLTRELTIYLPRKGIPTALKLPEKDLTNAVTVWVDILPLACNSPMDILQNYMREIGVLTVKFELVFEASTFNPLSSDPAREEHKFIMSCVVDDRQNVEVLKYDGSIITTATYWFDEDTVLNHKVHSFSMSASDEAFSFEDRTTASHTESSKLPNDFVFALE